MAEVFTRPTGPIGGARTSGALDQGLRSFMLGTYNYMALGVAGTAVVVMLLMANPAVMQAIALGPMKWVIFAALLGLGWFAPRLFFSGSTALAHGAFWAYCALWGVLISPMIEMFVARGLSGLIGQAFFIAAATFAATSLIGYTTKKDMTGWSGFLSMASIGLIIAMVINIFLQSSALSFAVSAIGVLIFAGLTAYDTQKIKEMYFEGDDQLVAGRKSIMGALTLYLDFINLFMFLLQFMGDRR